MANRSTRRRAIRMLALRRQIREGIDQSFSAPLGHPLREAWGNYAIAAFNLWAAMVAEDVKRVKK